MANLTGVTVSGLALAGLAYTVTDSVAIFINFKGVNFRVYLNLWLCHRNNMMHRYVFNIKFCL